MEINGEVNIEIDQYADVSIEIDTEDLAETLCQDHNLVDDVRMEEYFRSSVEDMVQDEIAGVRLDVSDNTDAISELRTNLESMAEESDQYELTVQIDDLNLEVDELREKIRKIEPDTDNYSFVRYHMLDNYVRINDLRDVIDAQVNLRLTRILSDVINGIQEYKKESDA